MTIQQHAVSRIFGPHGLFAGVDWPPLSALQVKLLAYGMLTKRSAILYVPTEGKKEGDLLPIPAIAATCTVLLENVLSLLHGPCVEAGVASH